MRTSKAAALLLAGVGCVSLVYGFAGHILIYSPWSSPGLRVVNIENGAFTDLSTSGADRPVFSPDGRKIAYVQGNEICFVNNDGTRFSRSGHTYTTGGPGYNCLTWNADAIYYNDGRGHIFRYDLSSRAATRIYNDSAMGGRADQPVLGYDQGAWLSADGMRAVMWTYRDSDPFRGANVLLQFDPGWGSYTRRFTHIWGHGWLMSRDGQHVVILSLADGRVHRAWDIYDFSRDSLLYYTMGPDTANLPEIAIARVGYVPNANDYITFASGSDTSNMHAFMQNWKTGAWTEVPQSWLSMVTNRWLIRVGGGWLGPLPSPTATTPEISLSPTTLTFTATGSQNVTATNTGAGALAKVTTAVAPASSWLTVTPQGSDGSPQTITNAVSTSGLVDGSYSATVTVSATGASNTAQYTVLLTVGTGITPPTGLTATVGGATARDVALAWTDEAANETGYSVERRRPSGSWSVVAARSADATSYTDANADTGTFEYRVRAVRNTTYSAYSNTATAVVYGLPTVTLASPVAGVVVTDSVLHIRWSAYQITNVEVKYSLDEGDTWISLNQTGGITTTNPLWGDCPWTVPSIDAANVLVWVHEYQNPGFGIRSGYFSIQRAAGAVRHAGVAAGGRYEVRVGDGGTLVVRSPAAAVLEVCALNGARVLLRTVGQSGRLKWRPPRPGAYLATLCAGDNSPVLTRKLLLAAKGR